MPLSKEILHSYDLDLVLKSLQKDLELHDGLIPSQFKNEDIILLYELGYNLYQSGSFQQSTDIFQRLVIAKPFEARFWQAYGSSLSVLKKYDEALVAWSMWCLIDDENPKPHFHAAEILFSLGKISEGLKALEAAEKRDTENFLSEKIQGLKMAWRNHAEN
jgi:tetratricopeptide (TPR) repeat protein